MPKIDLKIDDVVYQCTPVTSAGGSQPVTPPASAAPAQGPQLIQLPPGSPNSTVRVGKDVVAEFDVPADFTKRVYYQLTATSGTGNYESEVFITESPTGGTIELPGGGTYFKADPHVSMGLAFKPVPGKKYYVRVLSPVDRAVVIGLSVVA